MRTRCNMSEAEREDARADIRKIFSLAPDEVVGVRDALIAGKIDGSVYSGECCCLVGTIAKLRGIDVMQQACYYPLEKAIRYDDERPAERFFAHIKAGDTPQTNGYSKLALQWVDEWIDEQTKQMAFAEESALVTV